MSLSAKKQKLLHGEVEELERVLLSMNDDCLYKIFEWLHLDDVCSISETCKRLKHLSTDYFRRKYYSKLLHVTMRMIAVNRNIELYPFERYVRSFSHCFDTVIVNVNNNWSRNIDMSEIDLPLFIRNYFGENLRFIQFESMFLYSSVGDWSVLENVETVVFSDCDVDGTYNRIVRNCKRLKHLTVTKSFGSKIIELLSETFPNLEHFNCSYYGRVIMMNNLKTFLTHHPNLKRLTWCFHARIREATICDKTLECLEIILANGTNIEELFLSFDGTYNLPAICDKLKVLSDRANFKRLELNFRYSTTGYSVSEMMIPQGYQLATLKSLRGLHLHDFVDYANNILPTLRIMENLRILQLDSVSTIRNLNNISLDGLTSLEELYIGRLENVRFVEKFVCEAPKLKTISIVRCKFTISRLDIPTLIKEREKLPGCVCKLMINVDYEIKRNKSDEVDDSDLVKIELVTFQMDYCILTNPFINYLNSSQATNIT